MRKKTLLHIISTGKYDIFIKDLVDSAFSNFLPDTDLHIVLYTDSEEILKTKRENFSSFRIDHEPWPYPTLKRFHYFSLSLEIIKKFDYSFYVDIDSIFRKKINLDTLGLSDKEGLIGTLHPGFYGTEGTPERRSESSAYIANGSISEYYCGGFFGGNSSNFTHLIEKIKNNIDLDLTKNIIAIWHDESHLNRYFLDYPPINKMGEGFSAAEEFVGNSKFLDPYLIFIDKPEEIKNQKNNH